MVVEPMEEMTMTKLNENPAAIADEQLDCVQGGVTNGDVVVVKELGGNEQFPKLGGQEQLPNMRHETREHVQF